jgi:hypothetical protein
MMMPAASAELNRTLWSRGHGQLSNCFGERRMQTILQYVDSEGAGLRA